MSEPGRCAVHPVRRAVDACPVCARARCAADAEAAPGGGCLVCLGGQRDRRDDRLLERAVRGALGATAAALPGGFVAAEYVGAPVFGYVIPFLVGVLAGAAAQAAAAGPRRGRAALVVRALACGYAVLGVALGFVLEQSQSLSGTGALLPYAAAVAGVLLWTAPPRAARPAGRGG